MSTTRRPAASPAVKPIEITTELKSLMRRLKLGQLLDTLPERLALARSNRLPHHDFLEMLFADEVARRDRQSEQRRAKAAHLDPLMQLPAWDDTTAVIFDRELWAELTSLRFLADAYNVLILGPVGVGKTFLANALGHIAVRRHHSVHTERADKLFKRLRGARMADPLLAQSAMDRLQSAAYELVVEGESYRQRQKPRLGKQDQPEG
jgi:DNA replication protein DnaC